MTTTTDRPWLVPGAKIAVLSFSMGVLSGARVHTVDRLTATQAVLSDDTRWRLKDLHPVGEARSGFSTVSRVLVPLDDPRVIQARVKARLRNLHHVITPWLTGRRTDIDVAGALELLAQVKQAVVDTEARLAALNRPAREQ